MSKDEELELLKRRRMAELMKRLQRKEVKKGRKTEDPKKNLRRILTDRAREVLKAAESQYPEATRRIEEGLAHLVSKGKLKGPVRGEHLLWLFTHLGMKVRFETHIRVLEHGKLKTIQEKLKGE
ncbi:MAG: DNA-binding protein [Candidatus Bathyarchaeia archaeon]